MNVLNKISIKNLKLNKKRTISTIIGIILSTALICAACTLATSFQESLVQNAINETGYYHLSLYGIQENDIKTIQNNRDVKDVFTVLQEGYSKLEGGINENKPYLKLCSMSEETFSKLKFKLIEGRFAQNNNEIVISQHISTNSEVTYNIGDTIILNVGKRRTLDNDNLIPNNPYNKQDEKLADIQTREFKVVGIIERASYNFEPYSDPGYTVITTGDSYTVNNKAKELNTYIALKNPKEYETSIPEILGAKSMAEVEANNTKMKYDRYSINNEILRWEALAFSDTTVNMLWSVISVVVAIILFTSIFCIRNSFAISTTEKIKMYGMLSSVGATKKQIKKSVIFEALILGLIGIPLGILSGIFAVWVLLSIVNELLSGVLFSDLDGLVFCVSLIPVIISVVLGFLTVYLSAISSARKASKVSPIEQLRNTQDIKISGKKLKSPKIIDKIFHIGGTLAYKNLKRSKKKYRTTVVSLTVSITIFIAMNAFLTNALGLTSTYYENYDYNILVDSRGTKSITEDAIIKIDALDNIKERYILYGNRKGIKISDLNKINRIDEAQEEIITDKNGNIISKSGKYISLQVLALDNESFRKYAKKIGANYNDIKNEGILCDTVSYYNEEGNNTKEDRVYKYNKNDVLTGNYNEKEVNVKIGAVTDIHPYGYENYNHHGGFIILNYEEYPEFDFVVECITIESENPDQLEKDIKNLKLDFNVLNIEENVRANKSMNLVVQIFLYGFITVITLIGVTNIFNTITSNMELRQKEFAMLKSVGMTKREFNRMINLETIFYGTKSLIYGILLGILATFALYKAFSVKIDSGMYIPINAILISIIAVFVLIFIIMRYSVGKINKQNTIETIRRENV